MGDLDLDRLEALLDAARKVVGCTDHGCVLRVFPRGGMGTNGGCSCVGRNRADEGLMVYAARYDLMRLLTLARHTPALVAEVRRLRARCDALEAVVRALPACVVCGEPATRAATDRAHGRPMGSYCDTHAHPLSEDIVRYHELPYAAALRALGEVTRG